MNIKLKLFSFTLAALTAIATVSPVSSVSAYAAVTGDKKEEFSELLDEYAGYVDDYFYPAADTKLLKKETLKDAKNSWTDVELLKDYFSRLDDWSGYYTGEEFKELMDSMSGSFCGIGASVEKSVTPAGIKIVNVMSGSPAKKAGLKKNDIIINVDGTSVKKMDLNQGVKLMRGEKGTEVEVTYKRKNSKGKYKTYTVTLVRDEIKVDTVSTKFYKDSDIGYVKVSEFDEKTDDEFDTALDNLEDKGMKSLIIDLRDNPGGYIDTAVNMAGRILPGDTLVTTLKDKHGEKEEYNTPEYDNDGIDEELDVPVVILLSPGSASASELFTGCIKDQYKKKVTIIGEQSYGKGVAQSFIPVFTYENGENSVSYLKLTIAGYFLPSGKGIHGVGITPDIEVSNVVTMKGKIIDKQLKKAIKVLEKK